MAKLTQEEAQGIAILVLGVLYVISQIILIIIGLARITFWISIVVLIISFISLLYFCISKIFFDDWDKDDYWIYALFAIGACVVFYIFANISYDLGYSDGAIKTEMVAKGYIDWYNQFSNLENQAIEETINASCVNYKESCSYLRDGYGVYQSAKGFKDVADTISLLLKITS